MRHHVIDDANARGAMAASLGRWVVWTSRALQLQLLARRSDFRSWALCLLCLSVLDRIDTSSLCHCLRTVVGGYCTLFIDIHRVTGEEVWSHNTTTVLVFADGTSLFKIVRSEWLVGDLGSRVAYLLDFILRSA